MTASAGRSEPISLSSEPISVAVNEHVAARRLGLSVDTLRRDRRLGHLGIPFIKLGTGKHGTVRYDLADLDRFLEGKKHQAPPPAPQPPAPAAEPEPAAAPHEPPLALEPERVEAPPQRRSPPRTMWEALAETVQAEPEDDPFRSNVVTRPPSPGRLLRRLIDRFEGRAEELGPIEGSKPSRGLR
jgi:hypothetical protein